MLSGTRFVRPKSRRQVKNQSSIVICSPLDFTIQQNGSAMQVSRHGSGTVSSPTMCAGILIQYSMRSCAHSQCAEETDMGRFRDKFLANG